MNIKYIFSSKLNFRLKNEMKFEQRAEQILKHHRGHDKTIIEEKIINELQQNISAITNDLNKEIDKESKSK